MSVVHRLWSRVQKTDTCWLWLGCLTSSGYGYVKIGGKGQLVHRVVYAATKPIPVGHVVRHKCDNPQCVRPSHLVAGTQRDNVQDSVRRGRRYNGPRSKLKLSERQVAVIHRRAHAGERNCDLAREFQVSRPMISYIKHKKKRRTVFHTAA